MNSGTGQDGHGDGYNDAGGGEGKLGEGGEIMLIH